jgi:hypothetical protein
VNPPRDAQAMELEKRAPTGRAEGAGQDADRWPRDEAASASRPFPAGLAEEVRSASIDDLLGWVEQAQPQAERPLQLELAVAQTSVDRARTTAARNSSCCRACGDNWRRPDRGGGQATGNGAPT